MSLDPALLLNGASGGAAPPAAGAPFAGLVNPALLSNGPAAPAAPGASGESAHHLWSPSEPHAGAGAAPAVEILACGPVPASAPSALEFAVSDSLPIVECQHCKRPVLFQMRAHHLHMCRVYGASARRERLRLAAKTPRTPKAATAASTVAAPRVSGGVALKSPGPTGAPAAADAPAPSTAATPDVTPDAGDAAAGPAKDKAKPGRKRKRKDVAPLQMGADAAVAGQNTDAMSVASGASSATTTKAKNKKFKLRVQYDPEVHCGVVHEETLEPCTRAITCKMHTVKAKRAVARGDATYDQLVKAYQLHQQRTRHASASASGTGLLSGSTTPLSGAPGSAAAAAQFLHGSGRPGLAAAAALGLDPATIGSLDALGGSEAVALQLGLARVGPNGTLLVPGGRLGGALGGPTAAAAAAAAAASSAPLPPPPRALQYIDTSSAFQLLQNVSVSRIVLGSPDAAALAAALVAALSDPVTGLFDAALRQLPRESQRLLLLHYFQRPSRAVAAAAAAVAADGSAATSPAAAVAAAVAACPGGLEALVPRDGDHEMSKIRPPVPPSLGISFAGRAGAALAGAVAGARGAAVLARNIKALLRGVPETELALAAVAHHEPIPLAVPVGYAGVATLASATAPDTTGYFWSPAGADGAGSLAAASAKSNAGPASSAAVVLDADAAEAARQLSGADAAAGRRGGAAMPGRRWWGHCASRGALAELLRAERNSIRADALYGLRD